MKRFEGGQKMLSQPGEGVQGGGLVLGGSCIFLFVTKLRVYLCRSISFMA